MNETSPPLPPVPETAAGAASDPTQFPCENCGAVLTFAPGQDELVCAYCGHQNPIPESDHAIEELDFRAALRRQASGGETVTERVVTCHACAATFTLNPSVTADECPFCGSAVVLDTAHEETHLKPQSLLAFRLDAREAREAFRQWLSGLWFAPGDLARYARPDGDGLAGMYTPYWTFDARTATRYRGQRGRRYTTSVGSGKNRRTVTRIRWSPVSGSVTRAFDDVLVVASESLPRDMAEKLEPWDLDQLVPYDERYLSGFRAESYRIGLEDGFAHAKDRMEAVIRRDVRRDIGGDAQRITWLSIRHDDITYKHVLLPVWLAAYRYRDRVFRFMVNARTGKVHGQRPWSWLKIGVAVFAATVVLGAGYYAFVTFGGGSG